MLRIIDKVLRKIEDTVTIAGLGIMTALVIVQIIARFVFNAPLKWSEEVARFIFLWVVFIGVSYATRERLHIRLTLLYERFPPKVQTILEIAYNIGIIVLLVLLIEKSIPVLVRQNRLPMPATQILPMSYVFIAIPIGFSMTIIRTLMQIYEDAKKLAEGKVADKT